jgi:hypothetical protein
MANPLVSKVLGDPSVYPDDFTSFLQRYIGGNSLVQIDWNQLPVPRVTRGKISEGPPKNPTVGDIWIATDVDATGLTWQFVFEGSFWAFIGGGRMSLPYHGPGVALNTLSDLGVNNGLGYRIYADSVASMGFPRAGRYEFSGSVMFNNSAAGNIVVQAGPVFPEDVGGNNWMSLVATPGFNSITVAPMVLTADVIAGDWIALGIASSDPAHTTVQWVTGSIAPIRVT